MTRSIRKAHAFGKLDGRNGNFASEKAVSIDGYHNDAYWAGRMAANPYPLVALGDPDGIDADEVFNRLCKAA